LGEDARNLHRKAKQWAAQGLLVPGVRSTACDDGEAESVWMELFNRDFIWFWKVRVIESGRDLTDLLGQSKRGLRGLKRIRYGYIRVPGVEPVFVERFRPVRRSLGGGSITLRYKTLPRAGESAASQISKAERAVHRILKHLSSTREMGFGQPQLCHKPDSRTESRGGEYYRASPRRRKLKKRPDPAVGYREALVRLLGGRCSGCGREVQLDIHHKDQNPENNTPKNLGVLCRPCHIQTHRVLSRKAYWLRQEADGIVAVVK